MARQRRQIQSGLLHNSAAAYYAAIELHNKPNMPYRYQSTVLLMVNAWELLLKAYLRKYTKTTVVRPDGSTIEFGKAIGCVSQSLSGAEHKAFIPIAENLRLLAQYRNDYAHYFGKDIEPILLGLLAKASISYVNFRKQYFSRPRFIDSGLYILPLGFSLPFEPEVIFNPKRSNPALSDEAASFINRVAKSARELDKAGVEESVLVGFDVAFTNIKKVRNADIVALLDESGIPLTRTTQVRLTNDPGASPVRLSDEEFFSRYTFDYKTLADKCRERIPGFLQNKRFNSIVAEYIKPDQSLAGYLSLDRSHNQKRFYYSLKAVERVAELW